MQGYELACQFGLKWLGVSSITLTWRNSGGHRTPLGGGGDQCSLIPSGDTRPQKVKHLP